MTSYFEHSSDVLERLQVFEAAPDDPEHRRDVLALHGSAAIHVTLELAERLDAAAESLDASVTARLSGLGELIESIRRDAVSEAPDGIDFLATSYSALSDDAYNSLLLASFLVIKLSADQARAAACEFDDAMDDIVASIAMTGVNEMPPNVEGEQMSVANFVDSLDADDFAAHVFDVTRHVAEVLTGNPIFR